MSKRYPLGLAPAPVPVGFPGRVDFIKSAAEMTHAPHTPAAEVCLCGRSNVGKSTLINDLCRRRQLARVSSTPGRTRLINFFDVQGRLTLVDLPGYGWARAPKAMQADWGTTIRDYLGDRRQLCLTLLLCDIRRDPQEAERNLHSWFVEQGRPCLIVVTKADKITRSKRKQRLLAIARELDVPPTDMILSSSLEKLGREAIWGTILAHTDRFAAQHQGH